MKSTGLLLFAALLASVSARAESVEINEWLVPWPRSLPRDPFVDARGRVWFVAERGNYVGNLTPESGEFSRYDLLERSMPQGLVIGSDGIIWYAARLQQHIGRLNPATGQVNPIGMPDRKAKNPHSLALDSAGNLWFTVLRGNFIGRLTTDDLEIELIEIPGRSARPESIVVNSRDEPWATAGDDNRLLRVDPDAMTVASIELPAKKAEPRRLAVTSDNRIWWTDFGRGYLGAFDPQSGEFREWALPGGDDSEPLGIAADRFDRVWLVETGRSPNRFVGFEPSSGEFFSLTDIPSGGETVQHLHYFAPAGEIWFGAETNYIGRANVH